jgi:hypothetical protein
MRDGGESENKWMSKRGRVEERNIIIHYFLCSQHSKRPKRNFHDRKKCKRTRREGVWNTREDGIKNEGDFSSSSRIFFLNFTTATRKDSPSLLRIH